MGLKLGDISPLAGVISGEGTFGKLADKGLMGVVPRMISTKAQEKDEEKARQEMAAIQAGKTPGMKKGGKVAGKLATRGYGCVKK